MLRIRLRADLRCEKHPRFQPRSGVGAVKGGCADCMKLCAVYQQTERLHRDIYQFLRDRMNVTECPTCHMQENLLCSDPFHNEPRDAPPPLGVFSRKNA